MGLQKREQKRQERAMKRLGICTVSAVLAVLVSGVSARVAQAQDTKLGFVDLQRALMETEEGRKARSDLKKIFDQKQKELDEQQTDLKKKIDDLEKRRTLLGADKVKQIEGELQGQMQKVQQTYMRHQNELQQKEQEATGKIFERMQRIIAKISTSENFAMVFDRQQAGLVFAKPHLDLTNEVIRRYNAGEGKEGGGAPAGKPAAAKPAITPPKK
jgi:outer membrane protein